MIIFENVQSQRALEQASKTIVDTLERQLEGALSKAPWDPNKLSINTKTLNIRTGESEFDALLAEGILAYLKLDNNNPTELGVWNGKLHDDSISEAGYLKLVVDITGVTAVSQIMAKFRLQKPQLYSTALHELQHAYDNYRSGDIEDFETSDAEGVYQHSGRKRGYIDKEFIRHAKSGHEASHDEYQNYSHEINARYAQAIADTKAYFKGSPATPEAWMLNFKKNFDGWFNLPDAAKKRLLARAGAEHSAYRKPFHGKESNLAYALKGFDVKYTRDTKFSKIGYWFSQFKYDGRTTSDLLDKLELLAHKTEGVVALPLDDIRANPAFFVEMKNRMNLGTWERMGSNHMIYRP
ncbi:hypothetical protein PVA8_317 [Vibrio phage PVA8]|nr:hypothetical protein [Vibrio phage PC-Liy1]URQ03303.1 hypothetical protein PVA8_317 [Vibrio phage PVA8]WBM59036.1 hypothetical protein vBValMPVA8_314 [Vibrio phage vB_ValM_PVA8]